jgi:regulator of protease activity HflC (stomatin/prohibitin superfamily)
MNIGTTFSLVGWVLLVLAILYIAIRFMTPRGATKIPFIWLALVILAAVVLVNIGAGVVFISPEERGIVISALSPTGYRSIVLEPGLRWVVPYFESVRRYPISRQTYTMSVAPNEGQVKGDDSILARTVDGQEVSIDASVIYTIDPTRIVDVHIRWQDRYQDGLVRPLARGVIRDAVAKYKVEEVVSTERLAMVNGIAEELKRRMGNEGLVLVDFILRNITFSKEYAASVEQKQIAQQQAEQAKYLVQKQEQEAARVRVEAEGARDAAITRADGDAQSQIIRAKAEAQSLSLISQALQENPSLLTYRYIEKLAPNVGVILLPAGGAGNPFIIDLKQLMAQMPVSGTASAP